MKYLVLVIFILAFFISDNENYEDIFSDSYLEAVSFIDSNKEYFINEFGEDTRTRVEKISIVFPEIIKYSLYKDILETTALEMIYVNYGKQQADFSIGYFQMKPSFAEELELEIMNIEFLRNKYSCLITFADDNLKNQRKERIQRLKELTWQLKYLNCFYDYLSFRFNDYSWESHEYKIRFFATAYNHNFMAGKDAIDDWMYKKIFPYGLNKKKKQYAYSDIALFYFENNFNKEF